MKKIVKIIYLFLFVHTIGYSGEYADAFLELGVSARSLAMSNTIGAIDTRETAFYSNPAGLAFIRQKRIGMMYTSQFGLADNNYLGYATKLFKNSALAFSWIRCGIDDILVTPDILKEEPDPAKRKEFVKNQSNFPFTKNVEEAIFISYSRYVSKIIKLGWSYSKFKIEIPWGMNFKIIRKNLDNLEAYGLGLDIGGRLRVNGEDLFDLKDLGMINIGLNIQDATGTIIYWETKHQDKIAIGPALSFALEQSFEKINLDLNLGMEKNYRYDEKFRYGCELVYQNKVSLRGGIRQSDFTLGLGLDFELLKKRITLDYSFMSHDLGACHRIGGGIGF